MDCPEKYIPKINEKCGDCRFKMQASHAMVCGHRDAIKDGNGFYIYPPAQWHCDNGEFQKSQNGQWREDMEITARDHGWIQEHFSDTGITYYKKQNNT